MKPLRQLCTPRKSVFDIQRADTVLDLSDLIENRIQASSFFEENYVTEGMHTLLKQAFQRLEGQSSNGIFLLKQAMGGGKTHNLLTLGLLAQNLQYRTQVMNNIHPVDPQLGEVKVLAFSGRESDAPYGLWGALAEQLGKHDHFNNYYSPLRAPGQRAWETLLENKTVLILLDELPPYLVNAKATQIGNSDLSQVTCTALSNLLSAVSKNDACRRVCVVISDLQATYQEGSDMISGVLHDLIQETGRSAQQIEPVRLASDELYHILRTRLFEVLPDKNEVEEVAQGYARALRDAARMDITTASPEAFAVRIQSSYPFHPAIRDLYARFRENPGFQQTRGLIRLLRRVVATMWQTGTGTASNRYLIAAHDIDLNDTFIKAEISQINSSLDNAIATDIADQGRARAENIDATRNNTDAQDTARLILIASLANVPNAVVGLSIPDILANLAAPNRTNLALLQSDVLEPMALRAWYLHADSDNRLYFKNVKNLIADLEDKIQGYNIEQAKDAIRERLIEMFTPTQGQCYQKVEAFRPLDEIQLEREKITLLIVEPTPDGTLDKDVIAFYQQSTFKNRVAFLSGSRQTYQNLLDSAKRLRAIRDIIRQQTINNVAVGSPEQQQAETLQDQLNLKFLSALRETFTLLWWPASAQLSKADFQMNFENNKYDGEKQIVVLLKEKLKYEPKPETESFANMVERRLFTANPLQWSQIKERAATDPRWQWYPPVAIENLKKECVLRDRWRETPDGWVERGPFPPPATEVQVREILRNDDGEAFLQITAIRGDRIHYSTTGIATTESPILEESQLRTRELKISFLAVDSTGVHETGKPSEWTNNLKVRYRFYAEGNERKLELLTIGEVPIKYTLDGSSPTVAGTVYTGPITIPKDCTVVVAHTEYGNMVDQPRIPVPKSDLDQASVDPERGAEWNKSHSLDTTQATYDFLERAKRYGAKLSKLSVIIAEGQEYIEFNASERYRVTAEWLESVVAKIREQQKGGQVQLQVQHLHFDQGQLLLDWVSESKEALRPGDVRQ